MPQKMCGTAQSYLDASQHFLRQEFSVFPNIMIIIKELLVDMIVTTRNTQCSPYMESKKYQDTFDERCTDMNHGHHIVLFLLHVCGLIGDSHFYRSCQNVFVGLQVQIHRETYLWRNVFNLQLFVLRV